MDFVETLPGKAKSTNAFRPGTVFKNGRLLIFERYSLTVMNPWPQPLAWRRTTRRPFRPMRPEICLTPQPVDDLDNAIAIREYGAVRNFLAPVPSDLQALIAKFKERQWHMMALLARCPGAGDLVNSTPALAFALASNWVFAKSPVKQPMRAARSLCRKRQVEICDWLGFPARPSTIKILRKIISSDISIRALLDLRDLLWREEEWRLLQHAGSIPWHAIAIAARPIRRKHFTEKFMSELTHLKDDEATSAKLDDLRCVLNADVLRTIPDHVFHSLAAVQDFIAQYPARLGKSNTCPPSTIFPAAPVPGNEDVRHIATGQDLLDEAKAMHHCVASYGEYVMEGEMAIYRVLAPERATVALIRDNGVWRLGQVAGPLNADISMETQRAIYGWLSSSHS